MDRKSTGFWEMNVEDYFSHSGGIKFMGTIKYLYAKYI